MTQTEAILNKLNKELKVGSIKLGVEFTEVEKIPFSSCRLNYMTHGGIPLGRITEFSGADGSGKTTSAIDIAQMAQKLYPDKKVLICDIEHTFDSNWATTLGLDCDNIYYFDPDSSSAETVFNALIELLKAGEISVCILDSIGAMVSEQANEKEIGQRTYGGVSMALTEFSNKVTPILSRTRTAFIAINQMRDDMGSMYGGTKTVGGRAFRHACSERIEFRKGNFIDEQGKDLSRACENPAGNIVNAHLIKSKTCPPDRKVGFYTLRYLTGIDYLADLFDVAQKLDIIQGTGWYTFVDLETGEVKLDEDGKVLKIQGKSKVLDYLKENPEMYEFINSQTLANM